MRSKTNSFTLSDQTCTICIAMLLCIWLFSALLFVFYANNENTSSFGQELFNSIPSMKFQKTILKQSNNILKNKLSQSYLESISPELSSSGWKPIYIHTYNVRMPIEEMDYLLETYWYPRIPNLSFSNSHQETKPTQEITQHNEGIEDMDFSKLRQISKRQKKKQTLMVMDSPKQIKPTQNKVTQSTSNIKYPTDWSMSCFPSQVNNEQCILHHMQYWNKGVSAIQSKPHIINKYVTFLKDCGGFNNIRQGFEFHAMVAWVTNRTLVLPPDTPWYLIDRGGLTRGKDGLYAKNQIGWPNDHPRLDHTSNFDIWFDLDDMSMAIPVITASEFIQREYDNLNIPHKYYGGDVVNQDVNVGNTFNQWLTGKAVELSVNLPWGQLDNVLYWPSKENVKANNNKIDAMWVDGRKSRTYTEHLKGQPFIHFPACQKKLTGGKGNSDYRYLGQIARSIAFDDVNMDRKLKQVLRDHIHLNSEIMEYAAMVVSLLGAFKYSSLHIRRNELQYKYVWCSGEDSYRNIKPLIGQNEVLYIATDEVKSHFFTVFEDGNRKVYQWKDFFGPEAKFESTKNVQVAGKLVGEVEMVICAMGRIFFGTKESTFSSYIGRLRGYFHAPYTQVLYHHYRLTEDIDESSSISKSKPGKPYSGRIYKIPFKDLWEDLEE